MLRRPATALLAAVGCALLAFGVWFSAFHLARAQWADAAALHGFTRLQFTRFAKVADQFAAMANPLPYTLLAAVVVLMGLRTRGPRGGLLVVAILLAANVTTQHLKPALAATRPYLDGSDSVSAASWPSGHATASMALALCAVLVAPAAARVWVAIIGTVWALLVAYSVVLLGWHFPSDAFGGFAVAGFWTC